MSLRRGEKGIASMIGDTVDESLLFQRISTISKDNNDMYEYEFSPFLMTLFDEKLYMRKTPKEDLYTILSNPPHFLLISICEQYVSLWKNTSPHQK